MVVASSSATPPSEKDLEEEVIDYGVRLFTPPSSNDELLSFLDKVESLLVRVGQAPSETMRNALHPIMKALIGSELLVHSDEAVKVSVVLCLSEIMRITAPRQPYDDAVMKEIFQHIVGTFEKLENVKSHCYSKAAQILDNVSKVRACVMLLDLECDTLVVDIIKLFLRIISSSHANDVFTNMEEIIIWIIKESDEVSGELLMPLVDSIKNENQTVSPVSWQLGQNVLEKCSSIIRPYVIEAVKSKNLDILGYAGILSSICQEVPEGEDKTENENGPLAACPVEVASNAQVPPVLQREDTPTSIDISNKNQESENSSKTSQHCGQIEHLKDTGPEHHSLEDRQPGSNTSGLPKKRGRKPMKKHDAASKESPLLPEDEKQTATAMLSPEHPVSSSSKGNKDGSTRKRGRPKKNQSDQSLEKGSEVGTTKAKRRKGSGKNEPSVQYNAEKSPGSNVVIKTEDEILSADKSSLHQNENLSKKTAKANKENAGNREDTEKIAEIKASHGEELVGAKIRVWWPMDQEFYEGEVSSFDPVKKRHKVVYADGDIEKLNLAKERWEMSTEIPSNEDHEADPPVSSAMDGRKKRKGDSSRKQKPAISATKRSRRKVQGGSGGVTAKSPKPDDFWVADEANDNTATQGEQPGNDENTPPHKEETEAPVEPLETVNPGETPTAVA
ncbi:PREDICTED: uncharacterized protein LOC109163184 [Ipomoea nil]|uniref:uncharacterized protein LOC109163184 n=1 Tax=Ipomoea nil TaxID=35883 RepID=UPI0009011B8B|nr:PREDICTED: uncharacterized protein LOC109163184 [Ipomoea nil]